jgi:RNA polymerase primary sigma factor
VAEGGEDAVLQAYLDEIRRTRLLTPEEEVALARRARQGDQEAFHGLVRANLRFVVNVVKRYRRAGVAFLDLINEGNVGLMRAARKFDPERGLRFISYAVWWIRTSLALYLARQGGVLAVPAKKLGLVHKMDAIHTTLTARLGREPTHEELAAAMEVDAGELNRLHSAAKGYVELDKVLFGEAGPAGGLGRIVTSDRLAPVEQALSLDAFREELARLLLRLDEREARVVRLYFGLDGSGGEGLTFKEIGGRLGISREGARLVFNKALEGLRAMPELERLRDYWV